MLSDLEISQCIATKLCHDLAGAIGAINSGLDFIDSSNSDIKDKALDLIKSSSTLSVNRLVFFRHTYGIIKHIGEANFDEIKKVAEDFLTDSKVTLNFHEKYFHIPGIFISANLGKLILCLIQQGYNNLIHGGKIAIEIKKEKDKNIILIEAIGPSPKIDQEKNDILNDSTKKYELTTHNCTAFFTVKLAKIINVEIYSFTEKKDSILYTIEF